MTLAEGWDGDVRYGELVKSRAEEEKKRDEEAGTMLEFYTRKERQGGRKEPEGEGSGEGAGEGRTKDRLVG